MNEKIRTIGANDFKTKAISAIGFSLLPWVLSLFAMPAIIKSGVIPLNLVQPLSVGIPTLIGITAEELFTRKSKCRERLRKFSNSKTQRERIEESTGYEIEKEKLINLNKILEKGYDDLLAKENMISRLLESYNVTEKNDNNNAKEFEENIENIDDILTKQYYDVDIITTKSVLKEKFGRIRDKLNGFAMGGFGGFIGFIGGFIAYNTPIMLMREFAIIQLPLNIIDYIVPFVFSLTCIGYCVKINEDKKFVFKKINKELGDNAISEFSDYEKDLEIDIDLKNIIRDTHEVKLQLQIEKQKLENITSTFYSEKFLDVLIDKMLNDDLGCDKESTIGEKLNINDNFIDEQAGSYEKLLESSICQKEQEPKLVMKMTPQNSESSKK